MRLRKDFYAIPYHLLCVILLFLLICTPTINSAQEQYRRCRDLSRSGGAQDELSTSFSSSSSSSPSTTIPVISPLQGFYDSTCEICPNSFTVTETLTVHSNKTRAVVLATSASPSFEKALIVTAGLLSSKSRVTIVTGPNMPEPTLIRQVLFQHVPCDQHFVASLLLDFKQLNLDAKQLPCPRTATDPSTQSPGDIILCNIQNAEVIVNAFDDILEKITDPSVFLFDATCIAGLLASEKWRIPAVVLVEHAEIFLRHVLGAPAVTITTSTNSQDGFDSLTDSFFSVAQYFNPRYWYQSVSSALQDRLNSLDLTSSFVALNRARSRLKLRRVRLVADIYRSGGSILLTKRQSAVIKNIRPKYTVGSDSDRYYDPVIIETVEGGGWKHVLPNLFTIPDPLLPPCIACTNAPITTRRGQTKPPKQNAIASYMWGSENTSRVVEDHVPTLVLSVAFRNDDKGRSGSRRLMLAFWLARQSVKKLSLTPCNGNSTNTTACWNGPSDFQIIRPGIMPEVLPPGNDNINEGDQKNPAFITAEETTYLDTLARHKPIAMVSVCDSTNTWTQSLGPPVLCLDTSWPSRKIATLIVKTLRNINSKMKPTNATKANFSTEETKNSIFETNTSTFDATKSVDGLEWIVSIVERLSELREQNKDEWKSGWQMGQDVLDDLYQLLGDQNQTEQRYEDEKQQQLEDLEEESETLFGLLTLYMAWIVLASSLLYIPLRDYALSFRFQRHRRLYRYNANLQYNAPNQTSSINQSENQSGIQHQIETHSHRQSFQENLSLSAIAQEMCFRLPDLDIAWNMLTSWIHNTLKQWEDNEGTKRARNAVTTSKNGSSNHFHASTNSTAFDDNNTGPSSSNNSNIRRRRSAKRRH